MRNNSYKEYKTPVDILKEYNLKEEIALLPPLIIDELYDNFNIQNLNNYYNKLYHHVPALPEFIKFLIFLL